MDFGHNAVRSAIEATAELLVIQWRWSFTKKRRED